MNGRGRGCVLGTWRQVCGQVGTVLLPRPCKSKWSFADYSHLNVNCFSRIYTQAHDNYSEKFLVILVLGVAGVGAREEEKKEPLGRERRKRKQV